jgi:hypothetical protein
MAAVVTVVKGWLELPTVAEQPLPAAAFAKATLPWEHSLVSDDETLKVTLRQVGKTLEIRAQSTNLERRGRKVRVRFLDPKGQEVLRPVVIQLTRANRAGAFGEKTYAKDFAEWIQSLPPRVELEAHWEKSIG